MLERLALSLEYERIKTLRKESRFMTFGPQTIKSHFSYLKGAKQKSEPTHVSYV